MDPSFFSAMMTFIAVMAQDLEPMSSPRGTFEDHRRRREKTPVSPPEVKQEIEDLGPEVQDEIERLVKLPVRGLPISTLRCGFYRTYRWKSRYRSIRLWLGAVAALNLFCALSDPFIVDPSQIKQMLMARALISTMFVVGSIPLHRQRSAAIEAVCTIVPCIALLLITGMEGLAEGPMMLERYVVNACFVIASGTVLLRIESRYMILLVALTCVISSAFVMVSPIEPAMAKIEIIGFHVSAMMALLRAHGAQTMHRYRGVILSLHNEIQARKMKDLNDVLVGIARTDPLTGIANRRHFDETVSGLDPDAQIAILMIDIDHFKALNDTSGHAEGDRCLRLVARSIRDEVRVDDLAARFGGEEFAVLLRTSEVQESAVVAERIRSAVATLDVRKDGGGITVSLGVAQGRAGDVDRMIQDADAALYQAKHRGRNRVMVVNGSAIAA